MKNVVKLCQPDNRVVELSDKIKDVIFEFNEQTPISYSFIIGVLEGVKIDMYMDCCNESK